MWFPILFRLLVANKLCGFLFKSRRLTETVWFPVQVSAANRNCDFLFRSLLLAETVWVPVQVLAANRNCVGSCSGLGSCLLPSLPGSCLHLRGDNQGGRWIQPVQNIMGNPWWVWQLFCRCFCFFYSYLGKETMDHTAVLLIALMPFIICSAVSNLVWHGVQNLLISICQGSVTALYAEPKMIVGLLCKLSKSMVWVKLKWHKR